MTTFKALEQKRRVLRPGGYPTVGQLQILKQTADNQAGYYAVEAKVNSSGSSNTGKWKKGKGKPRPKFQGPYRVLIIFQLGKQGFSRYFDPKRFPVELEIFKGKSIYMSPPSERTHVKVTCSCPDFYFTWYWYTRDKADAMAGDNPVTVQKLLGRTKRLTDGKEFGKTPGSKNDKRTPGICKHIWAVMEQIRRQGYKLSKKIEMS